MGRRRSQHEDTGYAELLERVCAATGAAAADVDAHVQTLWDGYGEIVRVALSGTDATSVIVKRVTPPPGGRGGGVGHRRKLTSYRVEQAWYRDYAARCGDGSRVPRALALDERAGGWVFVLEDLDAAGFDGRRGWRLSDAERGRCLRWLAEFHATFMGTTPSGLWRVGTYWHLETRPDELQRMGDRTLRAAATALDEALSGARFKTLVHGDAKLANFCFGAADVAAVDFQYVGGGCGMKDVAYFLSCLSGAELDAHGDRLLDGYFTALRTALSRLQPDVDAAAVEAEWRQLYPVAWADFYRFLNGWSPGHRDAHRYARRMIERGLLAARQR